MLSQIEHAVDAEGKARNSRIEVGEAHVEILALVPQVGFGLVGDDAAVFRVFGKKQRVEFDVRQDSYTLLTEAFGDELLNPKAKHASTFRREETELVAAVQVVVIQEAGQCNGGVVDGVFAADAFGVFGVAQKTAQVDADERGGYQAEYRKRAEAAANGRLAKEACAPTFVVGALLQVAAGVGDSDQMRRDFLGFQIHFKVIKHGVEYAAHFDGAARFAGNEHERAFQIETG